VENNGNLDQIVDGRGEQGLDRVHDGDDNRAEVAVERSVLNETGTNESNGIPGNEQDVDDSGGDSEPRENDSLLPTVENETPPLPQTAPDRVHETDGNRAEAAVERSVLNDTGTNEANGISGNEQGADIVDNSGRDSEPRENERLLSVVDSERSESVQLPTATTPLLLTARAASPAACGRESDPSSACGSPASGYSIFIHSFL